MKHTYDFHGETEDMLASLARLIRFPSVQGEAEDGYPFGRVPAACLDEALKMAQEMGFRTHNCENYCGYAEIGEGKEIIGIAAHLDVVPAGEGWETDPFTMTVKGDRIYGRGVNDDKGAAVVSMYAMKALLENKIPLNKRVRLILGTNEENGSKCMEYYTKHEEPVTYGFTPDGCFPGIYGEKGTCWMFLKSRETKILDIQGGHVFNAVSGRCRIVIPAGEVSEEALLEALAQTPLKGYHVTAEGETMVLETEGVSAHASTPELGINANSYAFLALQQAGFKDSFVDCYMDRIGITCDGSGMNLKLEDAYGALTLNQGMVFKQDGDIIATIDIRYPVTYTPDEIRARAESNQSDSRCSLVIGNIQAPLFFPTDSPLVTSLVKAYRDVTGDMKTQPMVIGGGTYAKEIPGIIAFGFAFPDKDYQIHQANEYEPIAELPLSAEIIYQAIINLLEIPEQKE